MDNEFRDWVYNRAKNIEAREMCEDIVFIERLLNDVYEGRSVRKNCNHKNSKDAVTGFSLLESEFRCATSGSTGT